MGPSFRLPVYLDQNATTPLDPRVLTEMLPVFHDHFGNPASKTHSFGWYAEELVAIARERVATLIGSSPDEIVFTSGATEANNLALFGAAHEHLRRTGKRGRIVSVVTEHRSVREPLEALASEGYDVVFLSVAQDGLLREDEFAQILSEETFLVSVMLANNEIGVLQDIPRLRELASASHILFHCDATQAIGKLPVDVTMLGVDLLSLSAHKFYGPKGAGALFIRESVKISPLLYGGGHERGLRSGTLNVAGVVGLGAAAALVTEELAAISQHLRELTTRLWDGLVEAGVQPRLNGSRERRIPGNLNLALAGVNSSALIARLSHKLALSTTSACLSQDGRRSFVLQALGLPEDLQAASIRIGIGRFNTAEEIDFAILAIAEAVGNLRK